MKRKLRHSDNTDNLSLEEDEPSNVPHPTKRRRCSTLERGFAHLSVHDYSADPAVVEEAECVEDVEMPMEPDALTSTSVVNMVALPSSFEESAPDIHDVKMRKSTWYEPEPDRIVITELESSSDEESDAQEGGGELYVSPALLDHIRSRTLGSSVKAPASRALVLYRPMPHSATTSDDTTPKANAIARIKRSTRKEEDAMDLEP
ncbi:hypothetical protein AX14_012734 [Amanita brunnescens Koide BX004]|nr:hypothetical protein AX14_012734 [Amanita brunnescens Koide BX004]